MSIRKNDAAPAVPEELIHNKIYLIRGQKVMLDADLAALYNVATGHLVEAVKRNIERFPLDFMFQMTVEEQKLFNRKFGSLPPQKPKQNQKVANLISQIAISSLQDTENIQDFITPKYGGRRAPSFCFTEQGVTMLSAVLRSPRAVSVSIEIVRMFVKIRTLLASNSELSKKLSVLEKKYDHQFKIVFDAIRELMSPSLVNQKRKIGFGRD